MRVYSGAAWEQVMKREETLLRAYSKTDQLDRGSEDTVDEITPLLEAQNEAARRSPSNSPNQSF